MSWLKAEAEEKLAAQKREAPKKVEVTVGRAVALALGRGAEGRSLRVRQEDALQLEDIRRGRLRAVSHFDWVPEQSAICEFLNGILTRMPGPLRLEDSPSLGIVREHRG